MKNLRVQGRATQGVRLINLNEKDSIASIAKVEAEQEDEANETDENISTNESENDR